MTSPADPARAAEIIAAYGADATRWPVTERAGVEAALADDAGLRAAQLEAAGLDALLADWATTPLAGADDAIPELAIPASAGPRLRWPRWLAGGGIAAALVATLVSLQTAQSPTQVATAQQGAPPAAASPSDAQAYAMLFTMTPNEESLI